MLGGQTISSAEGLDQSRNGRDAREKKKKKMHKELWGSGWLPESDEHRSLQLAAAVLTKTADDGTTVEEGQLTVHCTLTDEEERMVGLWRWMTTSPNSFSI